MSEPIQKPGRSIQSVQTPRDLLDAVERRFGKIVLDLAASFENAVCDTYIDETEDALADDTAWCDHNASGVGPGVRWLNCPFGNVAPWAKKAASVATADAPVLLLAPASIGSNWFRDHVHGQAMVLALNPRVTFQGHSHPFPKDLILCQYGRFRGFDVWKWR